jgi:hypothetical protein
VDWQHMLRSDQVCQPWCRDNVDISIHCPTISYYFQVLMISDFMPRGGPNHHAEQFAESNVRYFRGRIPHMQRIHVHGFMCEEHSNPLQELLGKPNEKNMSVPKFGWAFCFLSRRSDKWWTKVMRKFHLPSAWAPAVLEFEICCGDGASLHFFLICIAYPPSFASPTSSTSTSFTSNH